MKFTLLLSLLITSLPAQAMNIKEVVYVQSPTDTDHDGKPDLIYVSISRPNTSEKLSTIYKISPYSLGGNYDAQNHNVSYDLLPQDRAIAGGLIERFLKRLIPTFKAVLPDLSLDLDAPTYANISAHSLGTGYSTGCPTVGDMSEALAAKAVIDWLNGRAQAFDQDGKEVFASWANGKVAMTGISYDGTLPVMVAATGVEGLKAIIPIAAISNWYDYYRANGLVVNPGGYVGEDADVLGYFIYKKGTCGSELAQITKDMGREHGDFSKFWQDRNYLQYASNFKAATFIIHGQNDWNVKPKNAVQLYEALQGVVPTRMFLHEGKHDTNSTHNLSKRINAWIDHFLENVDNGITDGPQVEVATLNGDYVAQNQWPNETTTVQKLYLAEREALSKTPGDGSTLTFKDLGKSNPTTASGRLIFLSPELTKSTLLSGTATVSLRLSVKNRRAANITVVLFSEKNQQKTIITRGWADPQNASDITSGKLLNPNEKVNLKFTLEPKQFQLTAGSKLGVMVMATDYDYTLRPKPGTEIDVDLNQDSFVELSISP